MRYLLLGLCSGLADEMVVWSLAAHGFGLVDPGTRPDPAAAWRERPAFLALRQLFAALRHGNFTDAPLRGDGPGGAWLLRFLDRDGRRLAIAWSTAPRDADAPSPAILGFGVLTESFSVSFKVGVLQSFQNLRKDGTT